MRFCTSGISKGGGGRSPKGEKFSILYSFSEILAKAYVGAPGIGVLLRGNPGSASVVFQFVTGFGETERHDRRDENLKKVN